MPTLSVCTLTKNEENRLPRLLNSVRQVATEILICDTGSTDNTVALATAAGARVFHREWDDDFAAPRNLLIENATADWLLFLDADEWLNPASLPDLERALTQSDVFAYFLLRRDHADTGGYTEMWIDRLVRRHPALHFRRRVHATFAPTLLELAAQTKQSLRRSSVVVEHDGYLNARQAGKHARALRLLAKALEDDLGDLYCRVEYGRTLLASGDLETGHAVLAAATTTLRPHKSDAAPPDGQVALLLEYLLVFETEATANGITPAEVETLCARWFPEAPPLLWHRARRAYERGAFAASAKLLEHLVRIGNTQGYDRGTSFDPRLIGDEARLNLAACYVRLGELKKAERQYVALSDRPAVAEQARANLLALKTVRK